MNPAKLSSSNSIKIVDFEFKFVMQFELKWLFQYGIEFKTIFIDLKCE